MKATEEHLLIFERHFSPEKRCRPPSGWGIMPSACFSAPPPGGLVEGASAGQHVAAGAAWVDLPQANPSGRASRTSSAGMHDEACEAVRRTRASGEAEAKRASQYPQRSRPSEQRHKNRQMTSAHGVAEITGRGLCWLGTYSPLRGCSCQAVLPAAHSFRNGLYAIKSALP